MSARRRLLTALAVAIGLIVLGAGTAAVAAPAHRHGNPEVARIRAATARFHNIAEAEDAGYVLFHDVNKITCIDMPGMGGMGVHYVNPTLVANPSIDPTAPEALVYAPSRNGTLKLAALEYLVVQSAWDSTHHQAPELFRGHPFDQTAAPNRFGLPAFYSQHVWAWKHNSAGQLAMWNPGVHCPSAS